MCYKPESQPFQGNDNSVITRGDSVVNPGDSVITRGKRQIVNPYPDPTEHIPLPGRTVAYIPKPSLLETSWFIVGDGLSWGGYENPALDPDTM